MVSYRRLQAAAEAALQEVKPEPRHRADLAHALHICTDDVKNSLLYPIAYDGYDPTWILGTHGDNSSPWSGSHATAYLGHVYQSQSQPGHGYKTFWDQYDPHKRVSTPSSFGRYWPYGDGPRHSTPVIPVVPKPPVTIIYPHGHGHNLGNGHGYKNIVLMRVPLCCEGCEEKWKDNLTDVPGFQGVNVERRYGMYLRVTVFGYMETHAVVKAVQRVKPRAVFWG